MSEMATLSRPEVHVALRDTRSDRSHIVTGHWSESRRYGTRRVPPNPAERRLNPAERRDSAAPLRPPPLPALLSSSLAAAYRLGAADTTSTASTQRAAAAAGAEPADALDAGDDHAAFAYMEMSESGGASTPSLSAASDAGYGSRALSSEREVAWLRRCLPVFVQPEIDINNGNEFVKVFVHFERDETSGSLTCKLCVVFAGESSYNRLKEELENTIATLCYRTFNRRTYKRTADINYMEFRGVDLDPRAAEPWRSVFTTDHGGEQQWSQGAKRNVGDWFSLMHHYRAEVPRADWQLQPGTQRPLVFLNTCNHMIGQTDNNPRMAKFQWLDYPFEAGDPDAAFSYVVDHVPTKCNLYSYLCFWSARNGGGCCDRHHTGKIHRGSQVIYIQPSQEYQLSTAPHTVSYSEATPLQLTKPI